MNKQDRFWIGAAVFCLFAALGLVYFAGTAESVGETVAGLVLALIPIMVVFAAFVHLLCYRKLSQQIELSSSQSIDFSDTPADGQEHYMPGCYEEGQDGSLVPMIGGQKPECQHAPEDKGGVWSDSACDEQAERDATSPGHLCQEQVQEAIDQADEEQRRLESEVFPGAGQPNAQYCPHCQTESVIDGVCQICHQLISNSDQPDQDAQQLDLPVWPDPDVDTHFPKA